MIALYIILGIILIILLLGLIVSRDMNYEKSVNINSPVGKVWPNVSSLGAMDKWSPWQSRDPNMKKSFTGTDGTVGARQAWVSDVKNVGEGSQTILNVKEPDLFETRLDFIKPFKSTAQAYVKLAEEGDSTKATWGFKSKMPYPMNLMKLFMNFEKNMDKDFGEGLGKLKAISEN